MTRINCVPVATLADQHLVAEYKESPRAISGAVRWLCRHVGIKTYETVIDDKGKLKRVLRSVDDVRRDLAEFRALDIVTYSRACLAMRAAAPARYTMGKGHVLFFYCRTEWVSDRIQALIDEMRERGFKPTNPAPLPLPMCAEGFDPTPADMATNLARLQPKLVARPTFYRYAGELVGPDFYGVREVAA